MNVLRAFLAVAALLLTAPAQAAEGETGTVTADNCGKFAPGSIIVKWDSGRISAEFVCGLGGLSRFDKGDRVKRVGQDLVKVSGSAAKPPDPPTPSATRGTVTSILVSVRMDDGTTREIKIAGRLDATGIGDKVELSGSSLKPARK
jgi:hypothetical protein